MNATRTVATPHAGNVAPTTEELRRANNDGIVHILQGIGLDSEGVAVARWAYVTGRRARMVFTLRSDDQRNGRATLRLHQYMILADAIFAL